MLLIPSLTTVIDLSLSLSVRAVKGPKKKTNVCNNYRYLANRAVMIDDAMRLKMAKDITLGMVYLHQRKPPIIHKDLKSLNILVDEQIRLKICDFGLSQVKAAFGDAKNNVIGTPQVRIFVSI